MTDRHWTATARPAPKRKVGTVWRPPRGSWVRIDLTNEQARMACRTTIGRDPGADGEVVGTYVGPSAEDAIGLANVRLPIGGLAVIPFSSISRISRPKGA